MPPSPELQPGDWHDTLVDLLATGHGIPEDRARRFLDRHAEEVRAATQVTCHARECPCPPKCGCCPATTTERPKEPPVPGDHPCTHCTHPKRAHLTDPAWCRNCPPDTSYTGNPGWHEYEPAKEQS